MNKKNTNLYLKRLLITFLFSFVFVAIISEGSHQINKEKTDRVPEIIELVIPAGTAERVAAGQQVTTIPDGLVFVVGDTLSIKNEDVVNHELGPLYIPPGTSASLTMEDANKYTLGCTFQPSKFFNFDVRTRTTTSSRVSAFFLATPPTTMFFFLYSLLIFPLEKKKNLKDAGSDVHA